MRQQLDSFNEFICSNMQEIVDEYGTFVVKPESQHDPSALLPATSKAYCLLIMAYLANCIALFLSIFLDLNVPQ